jgi:hypothetical protein
MAILSNPPLSVKDDKHPQVIKPKTWTLLKFTNANGTFTVVTPKYDQWLNWCWYINVNATGGAKKLLVRWVRDPKGAKDWTGERAMNLAFHDKDSFCWMFKGKKGVPVGIWVYHEGASNLTIGTREIKMLP